MAKAKLYETSNGGSSVWIQCPGCNHIHSFDNRWTWNGDTEKPTFTPSMLVNSGDPLTQCHSVVTDGMIKFLGDCFHNLKNQTVELPDLEE